MLLNRLLRRSSLLAGTAAVAATVAMGAAQAEPLKIGIIESLSGSQTSTGRLFIDAVNFVVDDINANGGFNGEDIIVVGYDNAGGTTGAADKFKQAVADGVHIVIQGASSAIAGQVTSDVRRHNLRNPGDEIIYMNFGAEAMELTGDKCHFYHFRYNGTAPMRVNALFDAMEEAGVLGTKVYSINQNYSWGRDMQDAIVAAAAAHDVEVVDTVLHEVNRIQDFAPFVAQIKQADPDTVFTGNWSNDLLLLMKATGDAGLDVRFATAFLDQVGNIANAGDTAEGHYIAHLGNLQEADKPTIEAYKAKTGRYPAFVEPQSIDGMNNLRIALQNVDFGGGDVDTEKLALALEDVKYETSMGPMYMRKEDHQAVHPLVVSRVEKGAEYPVDDTDMGFVTVKVIPGEDAVYAVQESCEMDRPDE